jgi:membrane protein
MEWPGTFALGKRLVAKWSEDHLGETAAALTYYGILALFPFLLFVVAITSLLLDPVLIEAVVSSLATVAPGAATDILSTRLTSLYRSPSGGLVTLGLLGAFFSTSRAVDELMQALNRCYEVRETRPYWKRRALSLLMTIVAGIFLILAALLMFLVPAIGHWTGGPVGAAITWLRFPVAALVMMIFWSLLYRFLPNVKPSFHLISPGSVSGVLVWLVASWGFTEYVRRFAHYEKTYGALGGVIILLVWMWLSSAVVLMGAELNAILTPDEKIRREAVTSETRGPRRPPEPSPA